jgi:hypothetical protein
MHLLGKVSRVGLPTHAVTKYDHQNQPVIVVTIPWVPVGWQAHPRYGCWQNGLVGAVPLCPPIDIC